MLSCYNMWSTICYLWQALGLSQISPWLVTICYLPEQVIRMIFHVLWWKIHWLACWVNLICYFAELVFLVVVAQVLGGLLFYILQHLFCNHVILYASCSVLQYSFNNKKNGSIINTIKEETFKINLSSLMFKIFCCRASRNTHGWIYTCRRRSLAAWDPHSGNRKTAWFCYESKHGSKRYTYRHVIKTKRVKVIRKTLA